MKKLLAIFTMVTVNIFAATPTVQQLANQIDSTIEKQCQDAKIKPNDIINDNQFVRRAYLTIAGRIPSIQEYEQFVKINNPNKRQELVKYLVNTPAYVSNMYNFWSDILRTRERINNTNFMNGTPYIQYIKDSIKDNVSYSQFVKNLLLSKGDYYTNPATGYYERDVGMPLDNLIGTFRVFSGIDIGCAQCHDDPFQPWTQMQFYQMASYFTGVQPSGRRQPAPGTKDLLKQIRAEVEELIKKDEKKRGLNNQVNNFVSGALAQVNYDPNKKLALPHDYKYKDAKPNEVVSPKPLFGDVKPGETPLESAVNWLTDMETNPVFAKNISNRLWGYVFGKPIIPRVDNIYGHDKLNDPLLISLANVFKQTNGNIRMFMEVVCNTKVFQRATYTGPSSDSDNFVYIGPVMRRLSAEQLWDSIVTLAIEKPEYFTSTFNEDYKGVMNIDLNNISLPIIESKLKEYNEVNGKKYYNAVKYKGFNLVRASEINDQGAATIALQQLGRSDRELIGTSSRQGSVTQVISLMNGSLVDIATKPDGFLSTYLKGKSPDQQIDIVFKAALSRPPTIKEKSVFSKAKDDDLIWAIINTNEFKFL